jgi:hypothetical protein
MAKDFVGTIFARVLMLSQPLIALSALGSRAHANFYWVLSERLTGNSLSAANGDASRFWRL